MFTVPEADLGALQGARGRGSAGSAEDCISRLRALQLPDHWWMYQFKVTPCTRSYSHKWTLCPCAHAGETARRRDPRTHNYKAVLCPLAKMKKPCPMGDACMFAHHVFEHWLHPSRYKTRLCSFGRGCNRPICFFAHDASELRAAPPVDDTCETDEREYLMQLMASQQQQAAGMALAMGGHGLALPAMHAPMHMGSRLPDMRLGSGSRLEALDVVGLMGMSSGMGSRMGSGMGSGTGSGSGLAGGRSGLQRQHSAQPALGLAPQRMAPPPRAASSRDMSAAIAAATAAGLRPRGALPGGSGGSGGRTSQGIATAAAPNPVQGCALDPNQDLGGGLNATSLLLGLQEQLASLGGQAADGSWPGLAGGVSSTVNAQSRISDPGPGSSGHLDLDPMRQHLSRVSDSGQVLGLGPGKGMAGLESLLSSALAGAISHPGTSASSPQSATSRAASLPLSHTSSGPLISPHASSASSDAPAPSPVHAPPGAAKGANGTGVGGMEVANGVAGALQQASGDATVQHLLSQLREQGIVTSKEQLVSSLAQLLSQLMMPS